MSTSKDKKLRIGIGVGLATYIVMVALFPSNTLAGIGRVFVVIALAYLAWKGRNWARILLGVWFALLGAIAILAPFARATAGNLPIVILIGGGFVAAAWFVLRGRLEAGAAPEQQGGAASIGGV